MPAPIGAPECAEMIAENRNQDAVERDVDCGANHGCHHGVFALESQHVHTCEEGGQQTERRAQRQNRNIAPGNKEVLADHKRHDNLRNHNQTRASDKRNGRIRAEYLTEKCNLLFRVALLDRRNLPGIREQIGNNPAEYSGFYWQPHTDHLPAC